MVPSTPRGVTAGGGGVWMGGEAPFIITPKNDIKKNMIVRKKRIKNSSTEISLQVSYGTPDVKQFVKLYRDKLEKALGVDAVKTMAFSEKDIVHYFENTFPHYDRDMRYTLAAWCFFQAVEKGFLIESTFKENHFYFSDELPRMGGRPAQKV